MLFVLLLVSCVSIRTDAMDFKNWKMVNQLPKYGTEFRSDYVTLTDCNLMLKLKELIKKQIYTEICSKLTNDTSSYFSHLSADLRNELLNNYISDKYDEWNEHSDHLQAANHTIYKFTTTPHTVAHAFFSPQNGNNPTSEQIPTSLYVTASHEHNQNIIGLIGGCFEDKQPYSSSYGEKKYHVFMAFQNHIFSREKNSKRFDELLTLFAQHLILHEKKARKLHCTECMIDKKYYFHEWETDQFDRTWRVDKYRDFFVNRDGYADLHPAELRVKSLG